MSSDALLEKCRALVLVDSSIGYRALHAKLKEDPDFADVGLKKVQTVLQRLRGEQMACVSAESPKPHQTIPKLHAAGPAACFDPHEELLPVAASEAGTLMRSDLADHAGYILNLDAEVLVVVNGAAAPIRCVVGVAGVSYISGSFCKELGLQPTPIKSSRCYETFYVGEKVKKLGLIKALCLQFPSGFEITFGPWVVDDNALVPMQTGSDFLKGCGGVILSAKGLQFLQNACAGVWEPLDFEPATNERVLALVPRGAELVCTGCGKTAVGMMKCMKCREVRYCTKECQKEDWPRHKEFCGKSLDKRSRPSAPAMSAALPPVRHTAPESGPLLFTDSSVLLYVSVAHFEFPIELRRGDASVDDSVRRFFAQHGMARDDASRKGLNKYVAHLVCEKAHCLRYDETPTFNNHPDARLASSSKLMQAIELYEKARSSAEAMFQLGIIYRDGVGVRADASRAVDLFRVAGTKKNHVGATLNLGVLYAEGTGVPQDLGVAVMHFRMAADVAHLWKTHKTLESGVAQELLVSSLKNLEIVRAQSFHAYEDGLSLTAATYKERADAGQAVAQYFLAYMVCDGSCGVAQDSMGASALLEQAAAQGLVEAIVRLGNMFQQDDAQAEQRARQFGIMRDYGRAFQLYSTLAEMGLPVGFHNLGRMYQHGQGMDQDCTKAMQLFRIAADKGYENAMTNLAGMLLQLGFDESGARVDRREPERLLKLAAAQGEPIAKGILKQLPNLRARGDII